MRGYEKKSEAQSNHSGKARASAFMRMLMVVLCAALAIGGIPLSAYAETSVTGLKSASISSVRSDAKEGGFKENAAKNLKSSTTTAQLNFKIYSNHEMRIGWNLPNTWNGYELYDGAAWYHDYARSTGSLNSTESELPWLDYAYYVTKITVVDSIPVENAQGLFAHMSNVTSADVSKLDMSNCLSAACLFDGCTSLKTLDMSAWNNGPMPVTRMFDACASLSTVKVGSGIYWCDVLPSNEVNGHTDWYSARDKQWMSAGEIYLHRDRIADTYSKWVPTSAKKDISNTKKCTAKISTQAWAGSKLTPNPTVKWGSAKLKKGTDYTIMSTGTNKAAGTKGNWVKIKGIGAYKGTRTVKFTIKKPSIVYRTRQQSFGTSAWVKDGKPSGRTGKSKRLEAMWVGLKNTPAGGNVLYRAYVQSKGWMAWKSNGKMVGAAKKGLRVEAFQIKLSGNIAKKYDVWYRVHAQKFGWLGWAKNGVTVGTSKYGYRLESVQVKLLPKGHAAPGSTKNPLRKNPGLYVFKRDTWSFENYVTRIDLKTFTDVFGKVKGAELYEASGNGYTRGVCYGFSASVGAIRKYGYPTVSSFGADSVFDVNGFSRSSKLGMTAKSFIEHCFVMQYDYRLLREMDRTANNYAGLVKAVESHQYGGTAIEIDLMGESTGHSVLPLGIKSSNANKTVISIYDNNYPDEEQTLTLFKNSAGAYTGFDYSANHWGFTWLAWETPADDVKSLMAGNGVFDSSRLVSNSGSESMSLVCTDTDLTVVSDGKTYELTPGNTSDPAMVMPVLKKGGSRGGAKMYWVGFDTSDMVVEELDEDASISVATETGSVAVEAAEGSTLRMTVSDEEANSVDIAGDEGDSFKVTYSEDNGASELEESEVSGVATSDVVETSLAVDGGVDVEGARAA